LVGKVIVACFDKKPLVQMENLLRSLPCAVFSKDIAGFCLTANKYQAEMAGLLNEKEMIGKSDNDMPWCAVADTIRKADAYVITENKTIVLEEHGTMAHGKKEAFLVTKSPFKDQDGNLIGIVGTAVNVTQQRKTLLSFDHTTSFMRMNQESSKIYLSKKEIECVNWMIKGKSASEIAMILAISTRTVESHMNNIKIKLNCYKQFQLGYLIGKYGYLLL
jgi:DNA-binding CsgD family transcriptional regulator